MSLNNTYFETKGRDITNPIPEQPTYVPPIVPVPPTPGSGSIPDIPRPSFTGNISVGIYNNSSELNALDKNIDSVYSTSIVVKEELDIFKPVFYLNASNDLTAANYCRIENRYYYAHITLVKGNLYRIECNCDRLMTFRNSIRQQTGLIRRNINSYNRYLHDEHIKLNAYESNKTLLFPQGFSKAMQYYLVTIGGASTPQ